MPQKRVPAPVVDSETGCHIWQGHTRKDGYGMMSVDGRRGPPKYSHRVFYERAKGPIPDGWQVHHKCGNKACVNPDHLEALSRKVHGQQGRTNRKLTKKKVEEIRRRYKLGEPGAELAREFKISHQHLVSITSGRVWQLDVECPSCGHKFDPYV